MRLFIITVIIFIIALQAGMMNRWIILLTIAFTSAFIMLLIRSIIKQVTNNDDKS